MIAEIICHPTLQHYGLITANLEAMVDWYRKVLGMIVNHRSAMTAEQQTRAPFSAVAFLSNDEVNHRVVFFETRERVADPDKHDNPRVQHVAFECAALDDLLGTYVRLKGLGILPIWAADHGVTTAFDYEDPDHHTVELNVNNYDDEWTATEHMKTKGPTTTYVDPDKLLGARKAGASPWELHERAAAGEFVPAKPQDQR